MNFLQRLFANNKEEPLANTKKYSVVAGTLVVSPKELVKSDKVKRQIEFLRGNTKNNDQAKH